MVLPQGFDYQLADGRPRPVAVEMPLDIMAREYAVGLPPRDAAIPPPEPDPDLIADAAKALSAAKQPVIFVGWVLF